MVVINKDQKHFTFGCLMLHPPNQALIWETLAFQTLKKLTIL